MATLGQRIKALRTAAGWSQPQLAAKVGVSQPSIANIEGDKTKTLRGATLAGLCRALNVSPEVLLGHKRSVSEEGVLLEAELLALWRALSDDDRTHVLAVARALARSKLRQPAQREPAQQKAQRKASKAADCATTDHGELRED